MQVVDVSDIGWNKNSKKSAFLHTFSVLNV